MSLIYRQVEVGSPDFIKALQLRSVAYDRLEAGRADSFDEYSLHFVASAGDLVVGALRVTCLMHGSLESQEHYPQWIIDEFGNRIGAASRMCVHPECTSSVIPYELTALAWKTVLRLGVRIDVTKARLDAVPFYMRMGYAYVRDSIFEFHRWKTRCALIAFPATTSWPTKLRPLFQDIADPCELAASKNADRFTSSYREFLSAAAMLGTDKCSA